MKYKKSFAVGHETRIKIGDAIHGTTISGPRCKKKPSRVVVLLLHTFLSFYLPFLENDVLKTLSFSNVGPF